jgi:hypothetical protein
MSSGEFGPDDFRPDNESRIADPALVSDGMLRQGWRERREEKTFEFTRLRFLCQATGILQAPQYYKWIDYATNERHQLLSFPLGEKATPGGEYREFFVATNTLGEPTNSQRFDDEQLRVTAYRFDLRARHIVQSPVYTLARRNSDRYWDRPHSTCGPFIREYEGGSMVDLKWWKMKYLPLARWNQWLLHDEKPDEVRIARDLGNVIVGIDLDGRQEFTLGRTTEKEDS